MRIAIVGSEEKYWTPAQREAVVKQIAGIFYKYAVQVVVDKWNVDYPDRVYEEEDVMWLGALDYKMITLVSGGCHKGGVDIWAEIIADAIGVPKKIYLPDIHRWEDDKEPMIPRWGMFKVLKGYKTRNMEIGDNCNVLYCFEPESVLYDSKRTVLGDNGLRGRWSGGCWTYNYAKKQGKEVHMEVIK